MNPAEVDAIILVGGQGTRLRPLTLSAPKPMLPTAGLPFLTHLLSRIAAAGIQHAMLAPQQSTLDAWLASVEALAGAVAPHRDSA